MNNNKLPNLLSFRVIEYDSFNEDRIKKTAILRTKLITILEEIQPDHSLRPNIQGLFNSYESKNSNLRKSPNSFIEHATNLINLYEKSVEQEASLERLKDKVMSFPIEHLSETTQKECKEVQKAFLNWLKLKDEMSSYCEVSDFINTFFVCTPENALKRLESLSQKPHKISA